MGETPHDLFLIGWMQLEGGLIDCAVDTCNCLIAVNPALTPVQQEFFNNVQKRRIAPFRDFLHSDHGAVARSDADLRLLPLVQRDAIAKIRARMAEALSVVDEKLIPYAADDRAAVFYARIRADYFRYIAEFIDPLHNNVPCGQARQAYEAALEQARAKLPPTDPILLAIAVNFSVFHHDCLDDRDAAIRLASHTLDAYFAANEEREEISQQEADEETWLVGMLQQNHDAWKAEADA
jgi:hypothetical protein